MRIFVTGGTGFIGQAVVRELIGAGHRVLGLARSDEAAATLGRAGADAHRGALTDLDALAAGAAACDGTVHLAFIHDFEHYRENGEIDRRAIEAMAGAMTGSGKPLVVTSGTATVPPGRVATEADAAAPDSPGGVRAASEEATLAAADRGVRSSVVRLPPTVHGPGDRAFVPALIDAARRSGFAAYVGDGANRWPAVHRLDAARLFRLAAERAAPGSRLHGAAEEGVPMRRIAQAIGDGLGVPVRSLGAEETAAHLDWLAHFAAMDNPTSSVLTRETLGWEPREADLLTDLRTAGYFA